MRSFVICILWCNGSVTQYYEGGKIENEMGGACDAYGGGERCEQGCDGET
jgi:hypothetical protein